MFRFIIHNLSPLKHVPFFALWFDAAAMIWNMLFSPEITHTIEEIEHEVSAWRGVSTSLHKFGGVQFNYGGKELGHIHGHGIVDVLFSRRIKTSLIREERAEDHHSFKRSGWVSYYIRSAADRDGALYLLSLAYQKSAGCTTRVPDTPVPLSAGGHA
ncbi:luciferase domain-containing protein [Dawidia soli]|uniref:DUF5519 family protein n=1 Tax=Dawidia soli TaxID=2782352 RepID=A0AAP2GGD7_9BACT|nr:luciferase family protein [Dawidia soli]MBT1690439.1 DUF5519 family protein [Dawidia soli]